MEAGCCCNEQVRPDETILYLFIYFHSSFSVDGEFEAIWKPNTILHSDGRVLWIPPAIFKTSCEIDVRYFPFDQQTCHMDLASWTYTNDQVVSYEKKEMTEP